MIFRFRYTINAPPWVLALFVLGIGIILYRTGTSVTRWILLATIIAELIVVGIYRAFPHAVQAIMKPLESMPRSEADAFPTLIRGDRDERLALLRSFLASIVVLVFAMLVIVGGVFLFLSLGF